MAIDTLWHRELTSYPRPTYRWVLLLVTTLVTISMYYEFYVLGSASSLVIERFHWSLSTYAYLGLVAALAGMLSAYSGSLADRFGRANLLVAGTGLSVVVTYFMAIANSGPLFIVLYCALGLVEGFAIVMTSALIRDFSPRVGRGVAMGFWTIGPVGGSYIASKVAGHVLGGPDSWRTLYVIAAVVGTVCWLVSLVLLRDLPASIRNEIVVDADEAGIEVVHETGARHELTLRERIDPRIVIPSIGVSAYLLIYITAVALFPLYLSEFFGFTLSTANNMMSIFWLTNLIAVLFWGFLSDRLQARKPFMLLGAVMMLVITLVFASRLGHPTSEAQMTLILAIMGAVVACGFGPFMAGISEAMEDINPARVAAGMALFGAVQRLCLAISSFVLPHVIGAESGWRAWWWVCAAGIVLYMFTIPFVLGPWRPRVGHGETRRQAAIETVAETVPEAVGSAAATSPIAARHA